MLGSLPGDTIIRDCPSVRIRFEALSIASQGRGAKTISVRATVEVSRAPLFDRLTDRRAEMDRLFVRKYTAMYGPHTSIRVTSAVSEVWDGPESCPVALRDRRIAHPGSVLRSVRVPYEIAG